MAISVDADEVECRVARVDLKADRRAGVLRVQGAFLEPGFTRGEVVEPLAQSLHQMAGWLSLEGVSVRRQGDLAEDLASGLGRIVG